METDRLPPDRGPPTLLVKITDDPQMEDSNITEYKNTGDPANLSQVSQKYPSIVPMDCGDSVSTNLLHSNTVEDRPSLDPNLNNRNTTVDSCNFHDSNKTVSPCDKSASDNEGNKNVPDDVQKRQERFNDLAKNRYRITDPAPYYVYVEHTEKNVGRLFPIRVGHYLYEHEEFRSGITDIVPIGVNRVKIITKTCNIANKLVDHPSLSKNKLRSYIPTYYTQRKGVVKLVDTMFSNEYLWENIQCEQEIVEIKRLRRKFINRDTGKEELVDRQMIVITFLGSVIPDKIRINFCSFSVEPWVYPVVRCFQCLRFGHIAAQCKGKPRCSRCGLDGHNH